MARSSLALPSAALLFTLACGPAATTPPATTPPAATPVVRAAVAADAPPGAAVSKAPSAAPTTVTAGAIPADVQVYAELTGLREALGAVEAAVGAEAFATSRAEVAKELRVPPTTVDRLLASIGSAHTGLYRRDGSESAAMTLTLTDAAPLLEVIAAGTLVDEEAFGAFGRLLRPHDEAKGKSIIVWFSGPKLLAFGDEPVVRRIAAVIEGQEPGLTEAARKAALGVAGAGVGLRGFVAPQLLDQLVDGKVAFRGPLAVEYAVTPEGDIRGGYRALVAANGVTPTLPIPTDRPLALARRLPAMTAGYLAFSAGIPGGRPGVVNLLSQLGQLGPKGIGEGIADASATMEQVGLSLPDLLAALGGEGVMAAVVRPTVKTQAELEKETAFVMLLEIADDKPVESVLGMARKLLLAKGKKAKVRAEGAGFSAEIVGAPVAFVRVRLAKGLLFLGAGPKDLVEKAAAAVDKGEGTLGVDPAHAHALAGLPANAQLRLWLDTGRALQFGSATASGEDRAMFDKLALIRSGAKRFTSGMSLSVAPEQDRLAISLDEINTLGVLSAVGIYGVRRYLASAKVAEAKNTVGAIARSAAAAYEREQLNPRGGQLTHALCKSAVAVPATVPRGKKYQASVQGADWDTGTSVEGWRCLKFQMSSPQYFQYTYAVGSGYKGPKRGGPDPGPNGFEVAAEGDLDGDGKTSLFTRTGTVNAATGEVRLATQLFVSDEFE